MKIGTVEINGKLILAPMAGYTNTVYRTLCKRYGASLTFTEMISDKGLLYENDKTWDMCFIDELESPVALQLFGSNVDEMVKAAIIINNKSNCDIIDINMGCPVKKVIKAGSGSALLQDVTYLEHLVKNVVMAVTKPVSVKIRIGWNHSNINCVEVAKAIERAGASAIIVHGRTKTDFYSGNINYEAIKLVKQAVNIPVIGNGDIKSIEDLQKMASCGVDAFMIGRASLGNPWIFSELDHYLKNIPYEKPCDEDKIKVLKEHTNELIKLKGEKIAILEMRSLAAWYVKGFKNNKEFKQKLINVKNKMEFDLIIKECFE